ncbi:DNA topoisomerase IB [Chryseolinea lacunae]|uniref:DNA topoisomerase IB n=1 Tax=Chryseolinea lacunae TaxID=2801331 RepID=A0ABS1L0F5_9BACT|nr:DNA topoisomerase IB [Chryseolinea lacunae]MBL0745129.1 DNA topoisomerase IB [Chryseolinea lacunae]
MPIPLTRTESLKIHRNYKRAAAVASLQHVNDGMPGIARVKKGTGFSYVFGSASVKNKDLLARIKKLAIPPAWTKVWICPQDNGHIQATGYDVRGRKQYRYHAQWDTVRNQTKFHHLYEFGKALPALRRQIEHDICTPRLTKEKVMATVVSLMERTFIRIGSAEYEKLYGSYGLTTLKDGHVNINGATLKFSFKGKKGVFHTITLKNKRLARIVKACRDIPGKELFQYINDEGVRCSIDSGMINAYIKDASGKDFSAKDFRTWAGTLSILNSFNAIGEAATQTQAKKNVLQALDEVSVKLGNTRTVCRKYYVHPQIILMYEENRLQKYLSQLDDAETCNSQVDHTQEEKLLMRILRNV